MNYRKLLLHFAALVLPLFLIVELFHYMDKDSEIEDLKHSDTRLVDEISSRVRVQLTGIAADVTMLRHNHVVMDYLQRPSEASLLRLQESFLTFSTAYGKYDQVRLLDLSGQELVRVNHQYGRAMLVPSEKLQNKSGRYYFEKALNLHDGSIYVSPFDLNIDNGQIETPWKPVIRLSTPAFDTDGKLKGFLILNYLGQNIIDEVNSTDSSSRGDIMLLNQQGYWLYSAQQQKSWGFMFDRDDRFIRLYPSAWDALLRSEEGQFETEQGLFTYMTLSPTELLGKSGSLFVSEEWWKLVSVVSASELASSAEKRMLLIYKLSPVFLLVLALVAWLWTRVTHEAQQGRLRIKQFSRVVEQSEELVFITDPEARIQYVNPAFERVTGYTQREVIGQTPRLLKSEAHGNVYYKRLWKTISAGKPFKGVFVNKRKDGSVYYEEKIISPIHDELGKIIQFVSTGRDVSELNTIEERSTEMGKLADCDTLTKLPNRISIMEDVKQAMKRAEENGKLMALALIDIDGLDWVNEAYGHYKGDQLLISFAQRVRRSIRKNDILGRLGGDEFLIIMEDFEALEEVEHHLEIALVSSTSPFDLDGLNIQIHANMGIVLHPIAAVDHKTLLIQADNAVKRAKKEGKNKLSIYINDVLEDQGKKEAVESDKKDQKDLKVG